MAALIPINDTSRLFVTHRDELIEALASTAQSGQWLNGPRNRTFACEFANFCEVKFCLPVANGTDALEIALRGLLIAANQVGGEVVTVANAGGYTTTACHQVGLTPVYVDIEQASQLVDPQRVIAALNDETRVIVATHLYGGIVDVPALRKLVNRAGFAHVPILEDCAQAHGGRHGSFRVGSLGNIATFSFYPTKNLGALGDAGAIATSDENLFDICKCLHQYGWTRRYVSTIAWGRNSRMDELQAAVLSALLPRLEQWNARRRHLIATFYQLTGTRMQFLSCAGDSVGHLAVALCEDREAVQQFLARRQIATDIHYPILDPDQAAWKTYPHRIGPGGLDVSRRSASRILTIPCFPFLTDDEVERLHDALTALEGDDGT